MFDLPKPDKLVSDVDDLIDDALDRVPEVSLPEPGDVADSILDPLPEPGDAAEAVVETLPGADSMLNDIWTRVPLSVQALLQNIDSNVPIFGGIGDDELFGTNNDDSILADPIVRDDAGGDDLVFAMGGDDIILAFGGDNTIHAGSGSDIVVTADGNDLILAGDGFDDVQSGRGIDLIRGEDGDDILRGGEGDDIVDGGTGNDRVIGGSDNDTLIDGLGRDLLEGRAGTDIIELVDDTEADRVLIRPEDLGTGFDIIRGFSTDNPKTGGDMLDLRQIDSAIEFTQIGNDVLVLTTPAGVTETITIALLEAIRIEDVLDGNTLLSDGGLVTSARTVIPTDVETYLSTRTANPLETAGQSAPTATIVAAEDVLT